MKQQKTNQKGTHATPPSRVTNNDLMELLTIFGNLDEKTLKRIYGELVSYERQQSGKEEHSR